MALAPLLVALGGASLSRATALGFVTGLVYFTGTLYWITRVWFFARRHVLHDDPVVFAIRDRVSWMAAGLTFLLAALAVLK